MSENAAQRQPPLRRRASSLEQGIVDLPPWTQPTLNEPEPHRGVGRDLAGQVFDQRQGTVTASFLQLLDRGGRPGRRFASARLGPETRRSVPGDQASPTRSPARPGIDEGRTQQVGPQVAGVRITTHRLGIRAGRPGSRPGSGETSVPEPAGGFRGKPRRPRPSSHRSGRRRRPWKLRLSRSPESRLGFTALEAARADPLRQPGLWDACPDSQTSFA